MIRSSIRPTLLLLALVGCVEADREPGGVAPTGSLPELPAIGSERTAASAGEDGDWSEGSIQGGVPRPVPAILDGLRVGRNQGFDRIVLEFDGEGMPPYRIEYLRGPVRQCASGAEVEVAGGARLLIDLRSAQGHDEQGRSTVADFTLDPELAIIRDLREICDFEGHLGWVVGLAGEHPFRVLELEEPVRLVVDIAE